MADPFSPSHVTSSNVKTLHVNWPQHSNSAVPRWYVDKAIAGVGGGSGSSDWNDITNKPATFPPSAHTHTASQITDFGEAVDDRVGGLLVAGSNVTISYNDAGNTLTIAATGGISDAPNDGQTYGRKNLTWSVLDVSIDWTDVTGKPITFPPSVHTHAIADVTGLQAALDGKSPVGHTHAYSSLTGIPATFAPSAHSHPQSDITNLVSDLALKAPIASPTLTGVPAAPTATAGTNTTQLATTAFVTSAVTAAGGALPSNSNPLMDGVAAPGSSALYSRGDHIHPVDTSREPFITAGTTAQYRRGDKSWQTLDKNAVGLGNVDNTSDANKPVSSAGAAADALRVLKAGDTMTGDLYVTKATPGVMLNKTSGTGQVSALYGMVNGNIRWLIQMGNATAEGAGNTGNDFGISRYDNAAAYVDSPLVIYRNSGITVLSSELWLSKAVNPVIRFGPAQAGYLYHDGTDFQLGGGNLIIQGGKGINAGTGQFNGAVNMSSNLAVAGTMYCANTAGCKSAFYLDSIGAGNNPQIIMRDQNNSVAATFFWDRSLDELGWLHYSGVKIRVGSWGIASSHTDCYKPTGGPWITGSDARIKTVTGRYESGLAEVLKLEPITYTYKGNDSLVGTNIDTSKENIGLVAQMVEPVMPEMVNQISGTIDGKEVSDLHTLDTGPLIYALVNAVKTLTARIEQLEGKLDASGKPTTAKSNVRSGTGKKHVRNTKKGRKRVHRK